MTLQSDRQLGIESWYAHWEATYIYSYVAHNSRVIWKPDISCLMVCTIDTTPIRRRRVPVDDKSTLDIDLHRAWMADSIIYLRSIRACPAMFVLSIGNSLQHCGGRRMGRGRR